MDNKIKLVFVTVAVSAVLIGFQAGPARGQALAQLQPTPTLAAPPPSTPELTAQSQGEPAAQETPIPALPAWSEPLNLSRSGATSAPRVVVDSNGSLHALWRDALLGFVYSESDGQSWSRPTAIETPFGTRRFLDESQASASTPYFIPDLIADGRGNIHAFWLDDSGRESGPVLYHSQVPASQISVFDAWSPRNPLSNGVLDVAAVSAGDAVHLAYVRGFEESGPAGIVYQRLGSSGTWSGPALLYPSPYLRALEQADAYVGIAAAGDQVVAVWDDPRREQVYVATSVDSGRNWNGGQEVDRRAPTDSRDASGPARIAAGVLGDSLVLTWSAGHEAGQACSQYYRASGDSGATWSATQSLAQGLPGCLTDGHFVRVGGTLFLLGSAETDAGNGRTNQSAYLLAWDGTRWSEVQPASLLTSFANTETNQVVEPRCLRSVAAGDALGIISCDQGIGGDIWWIERSIGDLASWFPPPSAWSPAEPIATQEGVLAGLNIVADGQGRTHAIWWPEDGATMLQAVWDGTVWSSPTPTVSAVRGAILAADVAAAGDRLLMLWRDGVGYHLSQASTDQPTEWSQPLDLPGIPSAAMEATILGARGQIVIAYAIALNEGRGIYAITSVDSGATWSEPSLIFDAVAAGWDMVGAPVLAESDGALHAQYVRRDLPPDGPPIDLGYSRSEDGGKTWLAQQPGQMAPSVWHQLLAQQGTVVHRIWAEDVGERLIMRHAVSPDAGRSWSEPEQVGSLPVGSLPASTLDVAGRPHLLGLDTGRVVGWVWNGQGWDSAEPLQVGPMAGPALSTAADSNGRLIVAYAEPGTTEEGLPGTNIYSAARPLDLPEATLPTPIPPAATAAPLPTAVPSPTPEPTATVVISNAQLNDPLASVPGAGSSTGRLALALIPTGFIVLLVAFVAFRAMRMRK